MNVVVANDISEVDRLHRSVSQFCREHGLSSEIEGDLSLALEEILVNVIRYGHPEGGKHEILVWLSLEQDCVIATVEDDGVPFNPLEAPEPDLYSPIETRPDRRSGDSFGQKHHRWFGVSPQRGPESSGDAETCTEE